MSSVPSFSSRGKVPDRLRERFAFPDLTARGSSYFIGILSSCIVVKDGPKKFGLNIKTSKKRIQTPDLTNLERLVE
jgi:hypothetical protein